MCPARSGDVVSDATDTPTLVPSAYPELEHEIYISLEPATERPTQPAPWGLDDTADVECGFHAAGGEGPCNYCEEGRP